MRGIDEQCVAWGAFSLGFRVSSKGSICMALKDGKFCSPLGDLIELDGGDYCSAGRVSAGERSEFGMVNLRSSGEIAAESVSPLL